METKEFENKVLDGVAGLQKQYGEQGAKIQVIEDDSVKLKTAVNDIVVKLEDVRKTQLAQKSQRVIRRGSVSDDCARYLGGIAMLCGLKSGKLAGDRVVGLIKDFMGLEVKTALSSSDIPLPAAYGSEVAELVSIYGAARQYGTVYPLGAATVYLPRLRTQPAFGLLTAGGTVTEVSPQTENVTFTAQKFGGLIRVPSEIDEDSAFAMGQFIARYSAREIARLEDLNYFAGTGGGSGAYGSVAGLTASTITNSKVVQMAGTKTKYSDATLANIRAIRAVVDAAALGMGAYYMHPTFEQHLSGLNTAGDKPYMANGINGASLDGFPIRWVDAMPAYSTGANASKVFILFGDMSYQYLGVRRGLEFASSAEAGFATDDILFRALERFTHGLMAVGAVSGLETAAS
jgi:HK97 family phage major capsid protein